MLFREPLAESFPKLIFNSTTKPRHEAFKCRAPGEDDLIGQEPGCCAVKQGDWLRGSGPAQSIEPPGQPEPNHGIGPVTKPIQGPDLRGMIPTLLRIQIVGELIEVGNIQLAGERLQHDVRDFQGVLEEGPEESGRGEEKREAKPVMTPSFRSDNGLVSIIQVKESRQLIGTWVANIPAESGPVFRGKELNGHPFTTGGRCANGGLCNEGWVNGFSGVSRCINLLQNDMVLQQVYATMLIGYARVSTQDQNAAAQVAALELAGCELLFQEKASGGRWDRPELHRLLEQLRKGDVLVVWKLDRLSRSLKDVLSLMERIAQAGAGFRSLTEAIDSTSAGGRMMMQIVGTFAEFERAMLRERTRAGLVAARKQGRVGGRRPKLRPDQQQEIVALVESGKKTAAEAARLFNVHPATVSRLLKRGEVP